MIKYYKLSFIVLTATITLSAAAQNNAITLEKIWKEGVFASKGVHGIISMNDGVHYTRNVFDNPNQYIIKYAYETGNPVDTLFNNATLDTANKLRFSNYAFSPDESKILITTDEESIYRRSSKAHFYAIDLNTSAVVPITDFEKGKQQLAAFSPTENKVAFVRNNNLFLTDLNTSSETQITTDGKWGEIINGAVDWVYEEEFSFARGFYWSPKGNKIAYYRFDESHVKNFEMMYYGDLYPTRYDFKYPKAGEENSKVAVVVYDLKTGKKSTIDVHASNDQYIPRIKWTASDDQLAIMRLNRHQNDLEFLLADVSTPGETITPVRFYREQAQTYIEINDNLLFLEDGEHFVWNSQKDGWNHIYLHKLNGNEVAQLTKGPWEVVEFYGIDQKNKTIYFSAAIESSLEREIYSISYAGALRKKSPHLSKDNRNALNRLTPNNNTNDAHFSKSFKYFINFESGADEPYNIVLFDAQGKKIRELETNEGLRRELKNLDISKKEFGTFKTHQDIDLNYWLIKPPNFEASKKYPAIFMIYGGPGRNTVMKRWDGLNYLWHQMLAQQGYIIISVDPRGTMYRGRDFMHSTYMNLGKLETEDMIEAAKYFGNFDFIDKNRLGMMGWSYGGFMSSLAMTKGADYFSLGIAVAPVTSWRYYDTIYTERFMRTPQENPEGYDDNSPINFVDKLKGAYLLIHGSADDNVHYQNTMDMIDALVAADKQFELFIYPNRNHGIYGGNTRYHLYNLMTDFIKRKL